MGAELSNCQNIITGFVPQAVDTRLLAKTKGHRNADVTLANGEAAETPVR